MMSDVSQSLRVLELFKVSFCASLQSRREACGRLSQITCKASVSSVTDLGCGWSLR